MGDRILIFNWNDRAERIVREVHNDVAFPDVPVVVVSQKPVDSFAYSREAAFQGVSWLTADLCDVAALRQIEVFRASCIVVTADLDVPDPDAQSALTVLAIMRAWESSAQESKRVGFVAEARPRIVVESMNHRKIELLKGAGATEVVCAVDYGLGVVAQTVLTPGISAVFQDLLTYSYDTNEVYILRHESATLKKGWSICSSTWATTFRGKTFSDAARAVTARRRTHPDNPCILLGVRRRNESTREFELLLNPSPIHQPTAEEGALQQFGKLKDEDELVVIAYQRPIFEEEAADA